MTLLLEHPLIPLMREKLDLLREDQNLGLLVNQEYSGLDNKIDIIRFPPNFDID